MRPDRSDINAPIEHAEGVETVDIWTVGEPTALDRRVADLTQLAQDRQIEINVWRGRLTSAETEVQRLRSALEAIAQHDVRLLQGANDAYAMQDIAAEALASEAA